MKATDPPSLARLRTLLHEAAPSPADAAAALAAERRALAGDTPLARELVAQELRWLAQQHADVGGSELAAAQRDWLGLRVRALEAAEPTGGVLFDLAEVEAQAVFLGDGELRAACERAIERAAGRVPRSDTLAQETAERFALLSTAIDELPIVHQIQLLRCTGRVMVRLAAQDAAGKACRRLGRRLLRAADDRELARRLEARIGRRGVEIVETTNFVLLLVVLGTLVLQSTLPLTPEQQIALYWIDAIACSFFVLDFVFELALHPSRGSWFVRNVITDLVPAIPSVMFLLPGVPGPGPGEGALLLRVLRLLRVTWAARYVQALRPLLRSLRVFLFLVRGLDGLAARFTQILNRDFVFVPAASDVNRTVVEEDLRDVLFTSLRREHELLALLPAAERTTAVAERVRGLRERVAAMEVVGAARVASPPSRDVPMDEAIEFLWTLRPQDVGRWLRPTDVRALDRVIRVLSAPMVRWLPIIRRVAVRPLSASAEENVVQLARRIADEFEAWHGRMLFFADLHGIVTGPQILDRVATAMVKSSQRPAVRLLVIGSLFGAFSLVTPDNCVDHLVTVPLLVLGSVCLVVLTLGHWLKRVAGQASEAYRMTSEAHFISQLERIKPTYEKQDLAFLAQRVFGAGAASRQCERALKAQVASARTGVPVADAETPDAVRLEANRIALLYLHFLDGAPLHISDVKTTEQLLAHQSIENLRLRLQHADHRQRKRLQQLKLDYGSIFSGPYLWFRFITESIAVEAAKRIAGYNRYCIPLAERGSATPAALAAMEDWLRRRRDPRAGRTLKERFDERLPASYPAAEFTALDFLGGDPERDRHLAALFGDEVLAVVRIDRRTMIREIFGTRPVHQLPKEDRAFNPLRFYERRLSHGRVLLLPLLLAWRFVRRVGWFVTRIRQIVREVFDPELAMERRQIGEAPFAVALRKIHRMKAPGLLAAMRMRSTIDPVYAGAPGQWSGGEPFASEPPIERDIAFLHLRERGAAELRERAAAVRRHVASLHAAVAWLPPLAGACDDETARAGELAVTCAWLADHRQVRTLLFAERWRTEDLEALAARGVRVGFWLRTWAIVRGWFAVHPVDRWLLRHGRGVSRAVASALRAAYARDLRGTRGVVDAWLALPDGASPADAAIDVLRRAHAHGAAVQRDVMALRAVQSLAVLDVRNYRDLVYQLGDYGADGGEPPPAGALP